MSITKSHMSNTETKSLFIYLFRPQKKTPVKGKMLNYFQQQMKGAIDEILRGSPVATATKQYFTYQ